MLRCERVSEERRAREEREGVLARGYVDVASANDEEVAGDDAEKLARNGRVSTGRSCVQLSDPYGTHEDCVAP